MLILPYIVRSKKTIAASFLTLGLQVWLDFDADGLLFRQFVTRLAVSMASLLFWTLFGVAALVRCMYEEQNYTRQSRLDTWVSNMVVGITSTFLSFLALILQL